MNNLTQAQQDAKQAHLTRQTEKMLTIYQTADNNERSAIVRQVDSFLEVVPKDAKIFWLKVWHKLEKLKEQSF
jgi:phage terminase Nu1 subunit (DNA packaging protein)